MNKLAIPWGAWYGQDKLVLDFPDTWNLTACRMHGGPDIGDEGIRAALAQPCGAPPLREYARGRRSAAILVDDLSRPTPAYRLLPYVLEELAAAGIEPDAMTIVFALAAHRPMTRDDMVKKVGLELVQTMRLINHNAYENLEFVGYSSRGIPIHVNRELMSCEVRLALGMITPRGSMFGGGAKLLLPGACGHQTIMLTHRHVHAELRDHIAEAGRMAGLGYVVNALLNEDLGIMGMVAGDPDAAFARGCELGKQLYATPMPQRLDVGVFNAFPKDTELVQAPLALVPLHSSAHDPFHDGSTIVICSACPEGLGWHSVMGPGTALAGRPGKPSRRTLLLSPGVNRWDAQAKFGPAVTHCTGWSQVMDILQEHHGDGTTAGVFPAGAIQMADAGSQGTSR